MIIQQCQTCSYKHCKIRTNLDVDVLLLLGLVDLLLLLVDHGLQIVLVVLEQHALLLLEPFVLLFLAELKEK